MSLNDEELLRIIKIVREPFTSRSLGELGANVGLAQAADGGKIADLYISTAHSRDPGPLVAKYWRNIAGAWICDACGGQNLARYRGPGARRRRPGSFYQARGSRDEWKRWGWQEHCRGQFALSLKQMGARVGLLDADIYGPSIPTLFDVSGPPVGNGQQILPIEKYGIGLMSIGFLLEDSKSAVIWRGPMLAGALKQFLGDVAWGSLDYLILDLPPGTGDIALSLSQMLRATGALIVTTPQEIALQDVYKAVTMNQKVGIPNLGVVENYSYFICGTCQTRHELFGAGGGAKVASLAEAPLLGQLPMDPAVREWSDAGIPVVQAAPESPAAQAFPGGSGTARCANWGTLRPP